MAAAPTFGPIYQPPNPSPAAPGVPYGGGTGAVKAGPVLKAAKAPVKVTVHPDGKVEVHHNPPTTPASTAPARPKTAPKPAAKPVKAAPKPVAKAPQTVEAQAQGLLDPVKKAILDAINTRTAAEQGAITNYSKDLAGLMGSYAPASRASYGNAEVGQAAVDAATQSTLSGQGQAGANELAAKLAQINADPGTAARLNDQAGANVTGAVGALAGRGSSSLSDLISRSASAQDYGAKLPGVAGLYGLQATKSAQSKATSDTATAVSQLEQQFPGLVTSLKQNQQQQSANETTRALAAVQALGAAPPWAAKILGVPPGTTSAQIQAAQTRATATTTAAQTRATATKQAAQTRAAVAAKKAATPKPPSNSDRRAALKAADLYFYGQHPTLAKDGKTVLKEGIPGIGYKQAVKQLMRGYGLSQKDATAMADTYYKGHHDRGYPYSSGSAKFTATRSQAPKVGATMKQADGTYVFNGKTWVKK